MSLIQKMYEALSERNDQLQQEYNKTTNALLKERKKQITLKEQHEEQSVVIEDTRRAIKAKEEAVKKMSN